MTNTAFLEIEHKYLMAEDFNPTQFLGMVTALNPTGKSDVPVRDRYFVTKGTPKHVYRHRVDKEIQQLTIKSLTDDAAVRREVNIDLDQEQGDQSDRVVEFLQPQTILWQGTIAKNVKAFYFDGCEVVYYEASFQNRLVKCIEIEATAASSIEAGKSLIGHYEKILKLDPQDRCLSSLFQLLISPSLSSSMQSHMDF